MSQIYLILQTLIKHCLYVCRGCVGGASIFVAQAVYVFYMEEVCPICGAKMIYPEGDAGNAVCPNCGYVGPPRIIYLPPRKLELPRYIPTPSKYAMAVRDLARQLGVRGELVDVAVEVAKKYGSGFPPYVVAAAILYLLGVISFDVATRVAPRRLVWNAVARLRAKTKTVQVQA